MYDLVIRNGKIVDGTGKPAFVGDVAIEGDRIVAVGSDLGPGTREIDAKGLLVTPGFVDVHSHYDAQVTWDAQLTPSSWHGCTTIVMGSCGVGFAPVRPERRDWVIGLMEGVEDIPGSALHEGIQWDWETFPEYLDAIEKTPHAIDFGAQVPHGALRAYVMGERGADNEEATADDIDSMATIVREAVTAGALGFSTSRTLLHKSAAGVPVPGTFATRDELFGIGRALGDLGRGVFQVAAEHLKMVGELTWMKELAEETRRPVMFNLSQTDQAPKLWKDLTRVLDEAAAEDVPLFAQVAGRAIGVVMCWEGTAHPFVPYPSYQRLAGLSPLERRKKLLDPATRAEILADTPVSIGPFEDFITRSFQKMFALGSVDYEPAPDRSIAALAKADGRTPQEVAYDLLCENDGQGMLYFPLFNYSDGNLDLLHELHQHSRTLLGLSDAGAHCGAICDGGMPTFMLTHWSRDRTRGPKLPLEHVVNRQTRETAHAFGLFDRGVLEPGMKADVNVINYENLGFEHPELVYDLPAGGRRLIQKARGYVATICSGTVISENGVPTGALPGRLVRGSQPAPLAAELANA
jgi:N-acyl-D-amino-acid deacylase